MFRNQDIQELLAYQDEHPALSVYFDNDFIENTIEANKLKLRSMLDQLPSEAEQDIQAVQEYFDTVFDWTQDRSCAVFSNQAGDFFKAYILSLEVPDQIRYSPQLLLKTLVSLHRTTSGYGIALVDQQSARLLAFEMGELIAEKGYHGEDIQRIKHGGGSHTTGRWRGDEGEGEKVDTVRSRNLREAAEAADDFFHKHDIRRIFLGGTEQNTAAFRAYLPKLWQSLITGVVSINTNANPQEVQRRVLEIGREVDQRRKNKLVDTVITEAAKGRSGVVRTEDVLGAVREGRVQTLLLDDSFKEPGFRCQGCEYLTVQELESCPFCGGAFETIDDTAEMAVKYVLLSGGNVEVVKDSPELQAHGGIAAHLRY